MRVRDLRKRLLRADKVLEQFLVPDAVNHDDQEDLVNLSALTAMHLAGPSAVFWDNQADALGFLIAAYRMGQLAGVRHANEAPYADTAQGREAA